MTDQTTDQSDTPARAAPVYAKMAVIGGGLIGSSVIRAARAKGAAGEIAVADANPAHRLVEESLAKSGRDNTTALVIRVDNLKP